MPRENLKWSEVQKCKPSYLILKYCICRKHTYGVQAWEDQKEDDVGYFSNIHNNDLERYIWMYSTIEAASVLLTKNLSNEIVWKWHKQIINCLTILGWNEIFNKEMEQKGTRSSFWKSLLGKINTFKICFTSQSTHTSKYLAHSCAY